MPIAVGGACGVWTMAADVMACVQPVQPAADGDEPLMQTSSHLLPCSSVKLTLWMKLYGPFWSCGLGDGHPVLWSNSRSPLRTTFICPLLPHTHHYRSSMPCTSRNGTVGQTLFSETNHSAPFELAHMPIWLPLTSTRHTGTHGIAPTLFDSSALTTADATLTASDRHARALLGLRVPDLAANLITSCLHTLLHGHQVWSYSDKSFLVLHFLQTAVYTVTKQGGYAPY